MSASLKVPELMTVEEFLAWDPPCPYRWQLVDGEPRAMAPASDTHGAIQSEFGRLLGSDAISADLLRRGADGVWPERAEKVGAGDLVLESIEFRLKLSDVYRTSRLGG